MARGKIAQTIVCSQGEKASLTDWANDSKTNPKRALREQMILACLKGKTNSHVAREMNLSILTVRMWRGRFLLKGLEALEKSLPPQKSKESDPT